MQGIPEKIVIRKNVVEFIYLGRGRFKEESNYEIRVNGEFLCYMKVFRGRGFYRPWIELYNFSILWDKLKNMDDFWRDLLKFFYKILDYGESLYIEYYHDREMVRDLERGVPVEETWLGKILKDVGFDRFKDWYIPEGMWEGGQKIEVWKSEK